MAFTFYIQTGPLLTFHDEGTLRTYLLQILLGWDPVADFPGDKRSIEIAFVDDQLDHSIKIHIPFLSPPNENEDKNVEIDREIQDDINDTLGSSLENRDYYLTGILFARDRYVLPGNYPGSLYVYNLDYCPRHPMYPVVEQADTLLQEIKRVQSQIGSHTNDLVIQMIKPRLNELIRGYNALMQNPLRKKLINLPDIQETFTETRKNYDVQKERLTELPWLNGTKNPVEYLPEDPMLHAFGFLTLKEMQTALLLISHGWTSFAKIAITARLASQTSEESPTIKLVKSLSQVLRKDLLAEAKLTLHTARKLEEYGFNRFHYSIKTDIFNHSREVNEMMARDPRYCLFFAKAASLVNTDNSGGVVWTHGMQNNIAMLLEAEPDFLELFLDSIYTGPELIVITENAGSLLQDLKKIGRGLAAFINNSAVGRIFCNAHTTQISGMPPDPTPWIEYVEKHTRPEKKSSPAP
ncbi:MAG TPA: hypothetical protein VLJ15_05940 [Gammaproteobacteria bacterium]|nr:hypothetical protein [Gammaproteobacteria bacterium]